MVFFCFSSSQQASHLEWGGGGGGGEDQASDAGGLSQALLYEWVWWSSSFTHLEESWGASTSCRSECGQWSSDQLSDDRAGDHQWPGVNHLLHCSQQSPHPAPDYFSQAWDHRWEIISLHVLWLTKVVNFLKIEALGDETQQEYIHWHLIGFKKLKVYNFSASCQSQNCERMELFHCKHNIQCVVPGK